jgi:hypothetical protein
MFTATVDLSGFRRMAARTVQILTNEVRDAAQAAAEDGAQEARTVGRFKDRTGKLRAGIVARFVSDSGQSARWEIVSKAKYSKFVEQGTRPHIIVPVRATALRFVVNGNVVFARKVNHPGNAPIAFMGPAYLKAERVLYQRLGVAVLRVEQLWHLNG